MEFHSPRLPWTKIYTNDLFAKPISGRTLRRRSIIPPPNGKNTQSAPDTVLLELKSRFPSLPPIPFSSSSILEDWNRSKNSSPPPKFYSLIYTYLLLVSPKLIENNLQNTTFRNMKTFMKIRSRLKFRPESPVTTPSSFLRFPVLIRKRK